VTHELTNTSHTPLGLSDFRRIVLRGYRITRTGRNDLKTRELPPKRTAFAVILYFIFYSNNLQVHTSPIREYDDWGSNDIKPHLSLQLLITSTEFSLTRTMAFSSLPLSQAKTISGSRALRCFQQSCSKRGPVISRRQNIAIDHQKRPTPRETHDATRSRTSRTASALSLAKDVLL
jgi:hypothetical protein